MDEFHFYADRERGTAWQVPLLTLPQPRYLLMSATLGDTAFFEGELAGLIGREPWASFRKSVRSRWNFSYANTLLSATVETLVNEGKCPVYVVHFTQLEAAQSAQSFTSFDFCSGRKKTSLQRRWKDSRLIVPTDPILNAGSNRVSAFTTRVFCPNTAF